MLYKHRVSAHPVLSEAEAHFKKLRCVTLSGAEGALSCQRYF